MVENIENSTTDFSEIKGITWRKGNEIVQNAKRAFIKDLDTLPVPAYDLLPLKEYYMPFFGNYVFIEAGRGCPYRCIYCRQTVMWESKVRNRSAEKLIEEIEALQNLGIKNILFHPGFPVDVRHNAKIKRLLLRDWAKKVWTEPSS